MQENPHQPPATSHDDVCLVPVELAEEKPNYWGPLETVGLSAAVASLYFVVNVVLVVGFMVASEIFGPGFDPEHFGESLEHNGLLLALGVILSAPFTIGSIVLFVYIRRGISIREYLGLHPVSWRALAFWLAATGVLMVCNDALTIAVGQDVVPQFMTDVWRTAGWLPLLWLALIVCAPLVEETFFRGFLFVGLQHSRLGNVGAVVITSLTWAAIHLQYDFFQVAIVFGIGILLGTARIRSRSLYVPMAMHALNNLAATLQTGWMMARQ